MTTSDGIFTDVSSPRYMRRFSDVGQEPLKRLMPIRGFEKISVVSLEQAVEPLIPILPKILDYVCVTKGRCQNPPADGLSLDESVSIMLYSMVWEPREECLFDVLNATLRADDRQKLRPWLLYLKLFLTALSRLPSSHRVVYRGIQLDMREMYPISKTFFWWGFSSCMSSSQILEDEQHLGTKDTKTIFAIECNSAKDIQNHSYYQSENEVLLPAATQFTVLSYSQRASDTHLSEMTEIESPFFPLTSLQVS